MQYICNHSSKLSNGNRQLDSPIGLKVGSANALGNIYIPLAAYIRDAAGNRIDPFRLKRPAAKALNDMWNEK